MSTSDQAPALNPYAAAWEQFQKETVDHTLTVVRDDGDVYRHLLMSTPGTMMSHWEVVTWPNYLTVVGDVGDALVFSRERDMFGFFDKSSRYNISYSDGAPFIEADYWSQKLVSRNPVRQYSPEKFMQRVAFELDGSDFGTEAEQREVLDLAGWSKGSLHEAHEFLSNTKPFLGRDWWEWDLTDFDFRFLVTLYSIPVTIAAWKQHHDTNS